MFTIFKRDLISYFTSPVAYIFMSVFTLFSGFFFFAINIDGMSADIKGTFSNLSIVFMFIVPVLTVKMMTEERKSKTDQILLTSPVKVTSIVLGKFFAAVSVFFMSLLITVVYIFMLMISGKPAVGEIVTTYIGFFLMGCSFISIGLFISSLTDNQFTASIISFAVLFLLWMIGSVASVSNIPLINTFINIIIDN